MNILGGKTKIVEVENRRYQVAKYTAFTGIKVTKMFVAKILPVFQSFLPMISKAMAGDQTSKEDVLSELDKYLDFEGISKALDLVSSDDLDYIMSRSLMCCSELLPAGPAPVMDANGNYGVPDIEYDMLIVLRLVCEAVIWGLGDFFAEGRLGSIMSPLSSSLPLSQ